MRVRICCGALAFPKLYNLLNVESHYVNDAINLFLSVRSQACRLPQSCRRNSLTRRLSILATDIRSQLHAL